MIVEVFKEMNQYITGAVIKELREKNNVTQLEPIADVLSVSVAELLSGNTVYNSNVSAN